MKKFLSFALAAILAVVFSAFTTDNPLGKSQSSKTEYWFLLEPGGSASDPLDYSLVGDGSAPPNCGIEGIFRCAILTEMQGPGDPYPGHPFVDTYSDEKKRTTQ